MTDTGNSQYTGQVNLPNDGQVTDVSTPDDNGEQTVPQSAASSAPPSPAPNVPQAGQTVPPQAPQAPGQPQASQGSAGAVGKNLPKGIQQPPANPAQAAQQRSVSKAGVFHNIAETLAGGPRYQYNVDAYGNMQKTKVPVSNAHLALAIAMEAISGAFTGYANGQGPGGAARAAGASFNQGQQQVEQRTQLQRQQAQEDYSRRAQVTETNARMFANAKNLSNADQKTVDDYIDSFKDTADRLEKEYPGYVHEAVGYSGLKKYNVTENNAIPYRRVARLDDNGKPVTDDFGNPKWDIDYLIIDPKFKATDMFNDEDQQSSVEMGKPLPEMANTTPFKMTMAMNLKSQYASWRVAKSTLDDFDKTLNEAGNKGGNSTANLSEKGSLTVPKITNTNVSNLANNLSSQVYNSTNGLNSVITPDNFNALIRGIINQESSGGKNTGPSKAGALGIMQLMPETARSLGVSDINDPAQNIKAGSQYFANMLLKYKDPSLALAAYNASPGRVDAAQGHVPQIAETQDYVKRIGDAVGLTQAAPKGNAVERQSLAEATKTDPSFPSALEKFMGALGQTSQADGNVSYSGAIKHLLGSKDPSDQDAGKKMVNYLGGFENITARDNYITTQTEEKKADVQTEAIEQRAANKQAADISVEQKKNETINSFITAKMPDNATTMAPQELVKNLQDQGVALPAAGIMDVQSIGQYNSPINVMSNRTWFKTAQLTQQDALALIKTINPTYNVGNFDKLKGMEMPNSLASKTAMASAAVSNHLNDLLQLNESIKNGRTNYPLLNRLEGELQTQTGGSDYLRLEALTHAINGEMGKVLSGGFAPEQSQVEALMKNMTAQNSYDQINKLGELYTGIMYGKIAPYDEDYNQLSGSADKHLQIIPNSFTNLVQHYGYDTPWSKKQGQQQQQQQTVPGQRQGETPVWVNGKVVGFTMQGKSGMRALPQQAPQQ